MHIIASTRRAAGGGRYGRGRGRWTKFAAPPPEGRPAPRGGIRGMRAKVGQSGWQARVASPSGTHGQSTGTASSIEQHSSCAGVLPSFQVFKHTVRGDPLGQGLPNLHICTPVGVFSLLPCFCLTSSIAETFICIIMTLF